MSLFSHDYIKISESFYLTYMCTVFTQRQVLDGKTSILVDKM